MKNHTREYLCSVTKRNMFMKKLLFSTLLLGTVIFVNAQSKTFKPLKFDFALGYAIPGGSGAKAGILMAGEPKYSINDNITVGVRFEAAIVARAATDADGNKVVGEVSASGSYLATADYFFNTNTFRPFVGVGAGLFSSAGASYDDNGDYVVAASGSKFGAAPRAGFELGHFRMAVEYNIAGKNGPINNNYLGIKLGFFVGGGRR
jgi:outer membrane protein W